MSKTKKRISAWNILWIVPLALILALAVMMYVIPAFEGVDRTSVSGSADWMAALSDETYVSQVVIPGTHDSATNYVQLAYFSKCQALSIEKQLEAGFRYLDIRLGDGENGLKLMHGFTSCTKGPWPWSSALMLSDVLKECYDFLDAHPTEFIVFCVKHEHGDSSESAFHEALMAELEKDPGRWYFGASLPTVGEARGRLVLLRRTGSPDAAGISFDWHDQGGFEDASKNTELNTNHNCSVYVQDRYEYEAEEKWAAFIAGVEGSEVSYDTAALNFLSTKGNSKYGHPFKYAVPLNEKLLELEGESISGWVIVDFASAPLAEHIYKNNF